MQNRNSEYTYSFPYILQIDNLKDSTTLLTFSYIFDQIRYPNPFRSCVNRFNYIYLVSSSTIICIIVNNFIWPLKGLLYSQCINKPALSLSLSLSFSFSLSLSHQNQNMSFLYFLFRFILQVNSRSVIIWRYYICHRDSLRILKKLLGMHQWKDIILHWSKWIFLGRMK